LNRYPELENNLIFVDTFAKVRSVLDSFEGREVRLSYSGGSDSDTVAWVLRYCGYNVKMVIFDTGLEYQATWRHVEYMRSQGFDIEIWKTTKSIPNTVFHYGKPFISKQVSDMLQRLMSHNFDFANEGNLSFDELYTRYPTCKSALKWWTNTNISMRSNISWNRRLKEFLILNNGIPFTPSAHCCYYSKKLPSLQYARKNHVDLMMLGIRRAEGGKRATTYKSCYTDKDVIHPYSLYLPIFWWKAEDKETFDRILGIQHSECYSEYGMRRTGCPGCPLGQNFEDEVNSISKFEPKLTKAVENLFGESYEWTLKYKEFQRETKPVRKNSKQKEEILDEE